MAPEIYWIVPLLIFYTVSSLLLLVALPAIPFLCSLIQCLHLFLFGPRAFHGFLQYAKASLIILSSNQLVLIACCGLYIFLGFDGRSTSTKQGFFNFAIFCAGGLVASFVLYANFLLKYLTADLPK